MLFYMHAECICFSTCMHHIAYTLGCASLGYKLLLDLPLIRQSHLQDDTIIRILFPPSNTSSHLHIRSSSLFSDWENFPDSGDAVKLWKLGGGVH